MKQVLTAVLLTLAAVGTLRAGPLKQQVVAADGATRLLEWQNASITTDIMVKYTPEWGDLTPDNRWASSAAIEGNRVTRLVPSGEAPIPSAGFVITGHGSSAAWIRQHLLPGSEVTIEALPPFFHYRTERELDAVDPSRELPAGGRQTNHLVLFTRQRGETTGTNVFGMEAVVRNGHIVDITGGNSPIPENGFVLSGHGRGSTWITLECRVGDNVAVEGNRVVLTRDRASAFSRVDTALAKSRERVEALQQDNPRRAASERVLREAEALAREARESVDADPRKAEALLERAERSAWLAAAKTAPSRTTELRGVWMGSDKALRGESAKRALFRNLASAHVNAVFPQARGFIGTPEEDEAFDTFIREAHNADIEVHLWTWLPTHPIPRTREAELLEAHPDWRDHDLQGEPIATLDPAHPEVRAFLAQNAVDIAARFDIDGIHFDWEGMHGGYSPRSLAAFRKRHGVDPLADPTPETRHAMYLWRTELVRQLAADIVTALRREHPDIRISSALQCFNLEPEPGTDVRASHQWYRWVDEGLLDMVCPMVYFQQLDHVDRTIGRIQKRVGEKVLHCPGLILYPETAQAGMISPFDLIDQIAVTRDQGTDGVVLFSYLQLWQAPWTPDDRLLMTLREGPFRDKAALPWDARK